MASVRRWRRWSLWAVALVLGVTIAWYAIGRAVASSIALQVVTLDDAPDAIVRSTSTRSAETLRVGTYNIAHGRGNGAENWNGESVAIRLERLEKIAEFLRAADLDLVVLNEVDFDSSWSHRVNQAAFLAEKAGFPWRVEQRNFDVALPFGRWACGNVVLSRYPITDARWLDLPGDATWESALGGKKSACVCTVELSPGVSLRIVPVHLSYRSEAVRVASVEALRNEADRSTLPLLLVGDFNSTPVGFPHADASGVSALALLTQDGRWNTLPTESPGEADMTFSTTEPTQVIDWIFVPRPWQLVSREVYPLELSDHRPLVGTVRMTNPDPDPTGLAPVVP